jgi:hypothetical protein
MHVRTSERLGAGKPTKAASDDHDPSLSRAMVLRRPVQIGCGLDKASPLNCLNARRLVLLPPMHDQSRMIGKGW